jgi:hypothetical protein
MTRNFEFRVPPLHGQRSGRFISPNTGTAIVIGAPVIYDANPAAATVTAATALQLQAVKLATGAQAPVKGLSGVAVYEHKGAESWAGFDPYLTTTSDIDTIPLGKALQVVSGEEVKVAFRNTSDSTFLNTRAYTGKIMVAQGAGSTPNVAVGDFLTPGVGDTTSGFWAKTAIAANAWLIVTKVDTTRGEVEARLAF